jgi:HupE / UreJ protein
VAKRQTHSLAAFLVALAALIYPCPAAAHDVPGELRIHAIVKAEDERLRVLARVPLELLLNLNLPERGSGYLDLPQVEEAMPKAVAATAKDLVFLEDGRPLPLLRGEGRISLPSDQSFGSFEQALAAVRGERLPAATDVLSNQGYFDAYLEYRIASPQGAFAVDFHVSPGLRDRLKLDLRFVARSGALLAYEIPTGSGRIELDPRWHRAAASFVKSGFAHIADGLDHLLFLLCLVLPFRRVSWPLIGVITAFTLAHSITLIAAAYGVVPQGAWFPPLVEVLIAASIIYMALENVLRPNLRWRWLVTALFGLVHGFGFSFMLKNQLQFAGDQLMLSLLAFNAGIEAGQLVFIVITIPLLALLFQMPLNERLLTAVISAFVALTAGRWLVERWGTLTNAAWPAIEPAVAAVWIALVGALALLAWTLLSRAALWRRLWTVAVVLLRAGLQRNR